MKKQDCAFLGTIIKTHGVDGRIVIDSELDLENKDFREPVFIEIDGLLVPFFILTAEHHQRTRYAVYFEFVNNLKEASELVGQSVYISNEHSLLDDAVVLDELVGIMVIDQQKGEIGECIRIDEIAGNQFFIVLNNQNEIMIPFADEFIVELILEEKYILLNLPEGLIDLNL